MTGFELKKIMSDIVRTAYPEAEAEGKMKRYLGFYVKVENIKRKSFHGQYDPNNRTIRLLNLNRDSEIILKTAIHELAHHIAFVGGFGEGHDKGFYIVYKKIVPADIAVTNSTFSSISHMEKAICGVLFFFRNPVPVGAV